SEMAAIMASRGNAEKAAFFDGVVKAIRLSEDADRLYNVGLLKRGIAMYLEALNYFADAYCIQSRLALQLEEAGEFNDAEDHYRQAYELMPDSFGRVESHCFGCEGVFNSERSQGMADRIFSRLVVETPDKPQVHYLLGYLRSTQERYAEAADLFRRATELDGEYLNAWKKLAETGAQLQLPPADLDALALVQLKLDPLGRHSYPDLGQVSDLTALWRAVEAAKVDLPKPAESIYVLTASKARLDEEKKTNPFRNRRYAYGGGEARDRQPGQVLASHNFIGEIMQLWQTGQSVESHRFID
ncbi:MAG: hypothetical protein O3A51_11960, partial [Verrucomicrobia bacterium]|nr:hypothetical protein [Verrucomicrobiota bacterium]